jgi:hypothetical protein
MSSRSILVLWVVCAVVGCSNTSATRTENKPPVPSGTGNSSVTVLAGKGAPSASAPAEVPPPAPGTASAPSPADSNAMPTAGKTDEDPKEVAELPPVKVANIGMHIGGGPNDRATKAPIKTSVEPHFDKFKVCFSKAENNTKVGDYGVDLLIEKDGGLAKVSHPRTTIRGDAFKQCMLDTFGKIEFKKPRKGKTRVSYSLRFKPAHKKAKKSKDLSKLFTLH